MLWANYYTSGFDPVIHPMRAEMAFLSSIGFRVDIDRVVRAGLHTGLASNTQIGVIADNSIVPLGHGGYRANLHTGGIHAMVAAINLKIAPDVGIAAYLGVFDPGAEDPKW